MLVADILHSCTNERVAEAAVASIGGEFAARLRRVARQCGTSVGGVASGLVRRFAREASERDWRQVTLLMNGSDLPLLCGLHAIVDNALRKHGVVDDGDEAAACPLPWVTQAKPNRSACVLR